MPFGVSWSYYLRLLATAIVGMATGSQIVHSVYKPLEGIEDLIEKEYQKLLEQHPIEDKWETLENKIRQFDQYHKEFEEYEKNKPTLDIGEWFASWFRKNK